MEPHAMASGCPRREALSCSFPLSRVLVLLALAVLLAIPASGLSFSRSVPFEMGEWLQLDGEDGPIRFHRVSIGKSIGEGTFARTKKKLGRSGDSEFRESVEILFEYSNRSEEDWKAQLAVHWEDEQGRSIDGTEARFQLKGESERSHRKLRLDTIRYGLDRAVRLVVEIEYSP